MLHYKLLNDLAHISKILNLCVEKIHLDNVFIETTCEILKLYGAFHSDCPQKNCYTARGLYYFRTLGYLIRVPCSQIRIQICKCIISFYHADLSVKEFEGYQPTSANYKKQIVELGGLAETLVLSLTLVENQLSEKLWIIKTLQHLSISEANCKLMMKAQAPRILCSHLNDIDPSGQLLFRSSEILWNLLEKTSKDQIIDQLSNLECVQLSNYVVLLSALKEAFTNLLIHGFRHYDRQLRNDILVIATLVAQNPGAPMIETGFAKQLILFATFDEVKSHNPLVKGLKFTSCYEDFELKKLLLNMLTVLAKDLCSVQLLHEDPFFTQGNSFHGTGGRGTKLAQMRFCLRVLNPIVSLGDDVVNGDLCDQGAIHQLLGILKTTTTNHKDSALVMEIQSDLLLILSTLCESNLHRKELFGWEGVDTLIPFMKIDAKNFYSGLGHNRLLFCALDCLWCCVMGCTILEDYFLEKEGLFTLLDLLLKKHIKKPLVGQFQKTQEVIPMPANCPTIAVMDVAENMRAKIYCLICKLGFENLPGLCARDFVTLAIIRRYLDFKVGEIWDEVCAELKKEKFRPVTPDQEALQLITEALENIGKIVVSLQTEMLESQQFQELQEEEKCYGRIHSLHKQKEMVNKSWENFLARTSNYEALKKAKRLREKSIENSRPKMKHYSATFHPTDIKGLNTTVASGRLVTVESTPSELIGGPLIDTDLALKKLPIRGGALKKIEGIKVIDSFKKSSVTVK
ncbi:hypothetical protein Chor_008494 [Crotalus horridus]